MQSALSKMPRNFKDFLKNGENKSRLIELIQDVLIENKEEILGMLKCQEIMFSMDKVCKRIIRTSVSLVEALCSNLIQSRCYTQNTCWTVMIEN